jgi:putative nucleotidyltransferase with HDIG domain
MSKDQPQRTVGRRLFLTLLFLAIAGVSLISLATPYIAPLASSIQLGQVAPEEILAPRDITYQSEVLTQQQRDSAVRAIAPIYTSPDTNIARQQLEKMRAALAFITSVRADSFSTLDQKMADIAALEEIYIDQETALSILALSDSRWQAIQQEAVVVLEQVMRNAIREDQLDDARRHIPNLVSLSLPEEQADIVVQLAGAFVTPNSFYSEALTESARQEAQEAVEPVSRTYMAGQTVVRRGQVINDTNLEALEVMGLAQSSFNWKDILSAASLVIVLLVFLAIYIIRFTQLTQDVRGLTLLVVLFAVFLLVGRIINPSNLAISYIYPLAAYSLLVAVLFGSNLAMITALPLAVLVTYGLPNSLELVLLYTIGGYFGVMTLGSGSRITYFFLAGLAIAVSGAAIALVFNLPQPGGDWRSVATLAGASALNGIAAASLTLLLQFFLAQLLGMTTALQLMEIARPDHKLLQLILRNAPGTYQHSLQVANLAEQAAEQIGADTLLTRVGALYHDVGKALNPIFFIENQAPGSPNPHDELDPVSSAQIIIKHVTDGLALAREHRIPVRIQDFILEHHGTMLTRYQYINAVKATNGSEDQVDAERFRYPGPRPQSRETAILMLADGSEARLRAERPTSEEEIRRLVKDIIQNRLTNGQLDDTDLTLADLDTIADSFTATLRGIYHPRIEYPKLDTSPAPASDPEPTRPVVTRTSQDIPVTSQTDTPSSTS